MRYSKQRENIKNGLKSFCIHPTAEELYLELKPQNPTLSLSTVYRNLNQLSECNEIKRIDGLSGQVHYDHNNNEHFHMICVDCGKIIDLQAEMTESLQSILKNETEFEIISYDLIVKGICKKCKIRKKGCTDGI